MDWPRGFSLPCHYHVICPWHPAGIVSVMGSTGVPLSGAWPSADLAVYVPIRLSRNVIAKKLWLINGATVSGNVDVGIYDAAGVRLVSSGSTAQAGVNSLQEFNITDTLLPPGLFYLALSFDNNVATTFEANTISVQEQRHAGVTQQDPAFPLPATATFASPGANLVLFGLATRTVL